MTECEVEIDRPRGSVHPVMKDVVYPLDYGFLVGTRGGDGDGIDVWLGESGERQVTGLVVTIDLYKRDSEQKILIGCSRAEADVIHQFHNVKMQHAMLLWR